ncbi:hypothetical protein ACKKBG_A28325 [Auxenochlorella protothecoides x Auxenochlorella symbiontica]
MPGLFEDSHRRRGHGRAVSWCPPLTASLGVNAALAILLIILALRSRGGLGPDTIDLNKRLLLAEEGLERLRAGKPSQASGGGRSRPPWLTIGIPTVPRRQTGTKYLQRTLETLLDELPGGEEDLWRNEVSVLVMNNAPGEHAEFEELRRRAATGTDRFSLKARHYVTWLNNPGLVADPTPDAADPDDLHNPDDRPGRQVRKQTCDLIALLRHAAPLSRYYFFMEDDFEVCPFALRALHTAAVKANAQRESKGWVALRVSYGMNGVLMHNADIPDLMDYLWRHVTRKPPDLLWAEWVALQARARPPRPYAVYRYNVLNHLGAISSFAVRPDRPGWPGCWAPMSSVWSLALSERYNRRCRDVSDVSPCATRPRGRASLRDQRGLPLEPDGLEPWMSHQVNWTAPVLPRT